jgi:hypothetical protein
LDLLAAGRSARLRAAAELVARAGTLAAMQVPAAAPVAAGTSRRGKGAATRSAAATLPASAATTATTATTATPDDPAAAEPVADAEAAADAGSRKVPAAERRRAVNVLLDAWRMLARDLALAQAGATRSIRDVALLEEVEAAAVAAPPGSFASFLGRLTRASELVDGNVAPELVLDVLLVRWPVVGSRA